MLDLRRRRGWQHRAVAIVVLCVMTGLLVTGIVGMVLHLSAPASGPLVDGQRATGQCAAGNGSGTFVARFSVNNTDDALAYLESASPVETTNLRDVRTLLDGQAPLGASLHDAVVFAPENDVAITITGRIIDPTEDAEVRGIDLRYAMADGADGRPIQYRGTLPWSSTQSVSGCR